MTKISIRLAVASTCMALSLLSSRASERPFSIVITAAAPTVKAGGDVWIKVKMINTSTHKVDCSVAASNGIDLRYNFDVRDESGSPTPKKLSRHPELEGAGSLRTCTLQPGQSTTADDNLISRLFDISRPGRYTVQVSRAASDDPKDGVVKSNEITIAVVP